VHGRRDRTYTIPSYWCAGADVAVRERFGNGYETFSDEPVGRTDVSESVALRATLPPHNLNDLAPPWVTSRTL